jgi:hypothetical protein
MAIAPLLRITVTDPVSGASDDWSDNAQNIQYNNAINGGFGTFSFSLPAKIGYRDYKGLDFGTGVVLTDHQANTLYEGRIEDITTTYGMDSGFQVTCAGHQRNLDIPSLHQYIDRSMVFEPRSMIEAPSQVPSVITMNIGQVQRTMAELPSPGIEWLVTNGVTVPSRAVARGALWYPGAAFDGNIFGGRIKFDVGRTNNGSGTTLSLTAYTANWTGSAWVYTSFYNDTTNGSFSVSTPMTPGTGFSGILFEVSGNSGTATLDIRLSVNNIRILGYRDGGANLAVPDEPVYGHEIVADIIQAMNRYFPTFCSGDSTGIEKDTSFSFDQCAWLEFTTRRQQLDYITSFYDRYWAMWEGKKVSWGSFSITNPTRTARLRQALSLSLNASILEAASTVIVKWQDIQGKNRSTLISDTRGDNVYRLANLKAYQIIDLGMVGIPSTAYGFGSIAFPDRSYEVVRGQITFPCSAQLGDTKAYLVRAGETIRIQDIVQYRDIGSTYDRRSIFLIKSVSVDWDAQTVTVDLDNSFDSLTQLQARTDLALSAKFGIN